MMRKQIKMNKIINQITEKDRVFGKLCSEAECSCKYENYFSALACLFVILEQIIKYAANEIDGNFYQTTIKAKEEGLIDETEFEMVNTLRKLRNKIFHENHYSMGIEINEKNFPIDEDEIKEILYKNFSERIFLLVLKLI